MTNLVTVGLIRVVPAIVLPVTLPLLHDAHGSVGALHPVAEHPVERVRELGAVDEDRLRRVAVWRYLIRLVKALGSTCQ